MLSQTEQQQFERLRRFEAENPLLVQEIEGMVPVTVAAEEPDTEGCSYHPGIEFPSWLTCPKCREVSENKLRANHFIRKRQEGKDLPDFDNLPSSCEVLFEAEDERRREQSCPYDVVCLLLAIGVCGLILAIGAGVWAWWLR